ICIKALYQCMLQFLLEPVHTIIETLESDNTAKNDYLAFQRRFCYLITCYKKLVNDSEDFYHNLFLIDLKDYQKSFIKTCLNDFYTTDQDSIHNIDIKDLMKQLINHISKSKNE
ncbi:hypothetical protein BDDG_13650, partial [Blastomyces dermatitidis ATCC 18188]